LFQRLAPASVDRTTGALCAASTRVSSKRSSSRDHRDTCARRPSSRLSASRIMMSWTYSCALQVRLPHRGQPEGQLTIAFDASIAPTFLDPAETPGIGRPFVFLYALHDALIKPLPGSDR